MEPAFVSWWQGVRFLLRYASWSGASPRAFEWRCDRVPLVGRHCCRVGNRACPSPARPSMGRLVGPCQVVLMICGCAAHLKDVVYRLLRLHVICIVFGLCRHYMCTQHMVKSGGRAKQIKTCSQNKCTKIFSAAACTPLQLARACVCVSVRACVLQCLSFEIVHVTHRPFLNTEK